MSDWLAPFRAREMALRANAVALLRSPAVLRVALAWRVTPIACELPASPCPAGESAIWRWIWEGVDVDEDAIAAAAGVAPEDARHFLRALILNRLIYPDGSVATIVDEVGNRALAEATLPKGLG